jgi:hypothetical protein
MVEGFPVYTIPNNHFTGKNFFDQNVVDHMTEEQQFMICLQVGFYHFWRSYQVFQLFISLILTKFIY